MDAVGPTRRRRRLPPAHRLARPPCPPPKPQVLQFAKDLALPSIEAVSCGCLGACGAGPNVALIPKDGTSPLILRHVGTPQRVADLLRGVCGEQVGAVGGAALLAGWPVCTRVQWCERSERRRLGVPSIIPSHSPSHSQTLSQVDDLLLKATEMRLAGNAAARGGNLKKALAYYTAGLELQVRCSRLLLPLCPVLRARPPSLCTDLLSQSHPHLAPPLQAPTGRHMLLSNRSGVRLELGDAEGALEDAAAAAALAPPDCSTTTIRCVEALLRLGRHCAAMECLLGAKEKHPGFAESADYKQCVKDVQAALDAAGNPESCESDE